MVWSYTAGAHQGVAAPLVHCTAATTGSRPVWFPPQVYAASIMFGYFLRRVDRRFQLESAVGTLPEGPQDAVERLERLFQQVGEGGRGRIWWDVFCLRACVAGEERMLLYWGCLRIAGWVSCCRRWHAQRVVLWLGAVERRRSTIGWAGAGRVESSWNARCVSWIWRLGWDDASHHELLSSTMQVASCYCMACATPCTCCALCCPILSR